MKASRLFYPLVFVLALFSVWLWMTYSYPRFAVIDLSVSRDQALQIAKDYLKTYEHVDPSTYMSAIVFDTNVSADRYLQKSIGFKAEEAFIGQHNLDLFYWVIRFMRQGQKEEFLVMVSSKSGEVISMGHVLDEAAARPKVDEDAAQKHAQAFLEKTFQMNFDNYSLHSKSLGKYDNRIEYTFNWEKKGVYIPWNKDPDSGGARLLTNICVSGQDVLAFNKQMLLPPGQFNRDLEKRKEIGRNLGLLCSVLSLSMMVGAIWVMIIRRNHLAMNVSKRFYLWMTLGLFALGVASSLNNPQGYLYPYPTTQPFKAYLFRELIAEFLNQLLMSIRFIIPCLAGELLFFEVLCNWRREGGFYHYLTTTFFSRDAAKTIGIAYLFAMIMIGLQTVLFEFGYKYLGVWTEQARLNSLSSGYFPFLVALILAVEASFVEETFFRLFGINFGIKYFKNTAFAVLLSSFIWGTGHTAYMVFPFWFRGMEVTILGVFLSCIYLRFGIISVIVIHYLFDVFWASAPYLFGHSDPLNFSMSIVIFMLPLGFALAAFLKNEPVVRKKVQWLLNKAQHYNVEILKGFVLRKRAEPGFDSLILQSELIRNGWDVAVVEVAFRQLNIPLSDEKEGRGV